MPDHPGLFTPVKVGPLELPNRIVMSPMTRIRAGEGCVPSERMVRYYSQRASAGLIVMGAMVAPVYLVPALAVILLGALLIGRAGPRLPARAHPRSTEISDAAAPLASSTQAA